jgi:immunoglobulin-binding protein 1
MDDTDSRSLKEIYQQARLLRDQLAEQDPRSSAHNDLLSAILKDLRQCQKLIDDLSIFSSNEDLEDLSTQALQYLSIDFLLADLLQRSYDGNRLAALRNISGLLDNFLTRLDQYSILSKDDRKLFEQYQESKTSFSILPSNPEVRRRIKIKRFQEEKELKRQLQVWGIYDMGFFMMLTFLLVFAVLIIDHRN